jgi:uncharacterized lipoprotein YddW (UPF0748 family)
MRRHTASVVLIAALAAVTSALPAAAQPAQLAAACTSNPATPHRQFRALWIASVANIDWPSQTGLSVTAQKNEFK